MFSEPVKPAEMPCEAMQGQFRPRYAGVRFGLASAEGMDGSASPRLREQQKGCENASLMKKVHDVPASHQLREE